MIWWTESSKTRKTMEGFGNIMQKDGIEMDRCQVGRIS
jgi:hypothetical protein